MSYIKINRILFTLLLVVFLIAGITEQSNAKNTIHNSDGEYKQGLVGAWYHGNDLTRIGANMILKTLDVTWDVISGRGAGWSAQWEGYITAPESGEINFYAMCDRELILKIAGEEVLHVGEGNSKSTAKLVMIKDHKYHINVSYLQKKGGETHFKVLWSWKGKDINPIPAEALNFSKERADWWNYVEAPDADKFDIKNFNAVPVINHLVYCEPGRFAGWPANNGVWVWGNEILVGFELGYHNPDVSGGHSIREDLPHENVLSRSLDGGITWKLETPLDFVDSEVDKKSLYKTSASVNFKHPDFAMRIGGNRYFISYNRGKTWTGPYKITLNADGEIIGNLTSRTDYLVIGPKKCLVFMSTETGMVESDYQDRSFCAITNNGGKTFDFLGWMTQEKEIRSVMSSTVKIEEDHLVAVLRRKHEQSFDGRPTKVKNWIEAAESKDNGKTWSNLGKVAETDLGERNGNPPAMVRLADGRLCVAYGYREFPFGIRMKVSIDNGKSWGKEYIIRSDGSTWDLGYPRMVVNSQGKIVIIYYFTTKNNYAQHIGVSILDSENVK